MEKGIYKWLLNHRDWNVPVTGDMIWEIALVVCKDEFFTASAGCWQI